MLSCVSFKVPNPSLCNCSTDAVSIHTHAHTCKCVWALGCNRLGTPMSEPYFLAPAMQQKVEEVWRRWTFGSATITIGTNDAIHPGPRAWSVDMVLVAGPPAPWQLLILIQGKLAPQGATTFWLRSTGLDPGVFTKQINWLISNINEALLLHHLWCRMDIYSHFCISGAP